MKRKIDSIEQRQALNRAAQMPALFHTLPDQDFDLAKSEVVRWLCEQPEVQQMVFNWCNGRGAIVFDRATRQWKGYEMP